MSLRAVIGVPTLNGPDRLDRALGAIFRATDSDLLAECRVIVADDGSDDAPLGQAKAVAGRFAVDMLFGHGRTGVAATWNRIVRHCPTARAVVLINDDVEVVADWLSVLLHTIEANANIGMASLNCRMGVTASQITEPPRIDYHEAHIMSGGGGLLSSGGAIFALRRDAYDLVGGFDERYFCFYEEVDIGVALRKAGLWNVIVSYPHPFHLGGATTSEPRNIIAPMHLAESRRLFAEKWGKTPDQLRAELTRLPPAFAEWNSQMMFLRH